MQFFRGASYSTRLSCAYRAPTRGWLIIANISWKRSSCGEGITCRLIENTVWPKRYATTKLARRAKTLEGRQTFQNLAEKWKGLAADLERAEASLEKLDEKGFRRSPTYPYD